MISAKKYLEAAKALIKQGEPTDGCTLPFKEYIHRWFKKSKLICAAHDFGSRGLIEGVRPGWHNNMHFIKANWHCGHYVWGVISFIATLPYAIVYYNLKIKVPMAVFYSFLTFASGVGYLIYLEMA